MNPLNQLLKKLIKTSTGRTRFILAGVGLSVALLLILSAVQIQANYNELLYSKTNQDSIANFLVINKTINDKTVGATNLSDAEIAICENVNGDLMQRLNYSLSGKKLNMAAKIGYAILLPFKGALALALNWNRTKGLLNFLIHRIFK